jgi:hypothetical protein
MRDSTPDNAQPLHVSHSAQETSTVLSTSSQLLHDQTPAQDTSANTSLPSSTYV